MIKFKLMIGDHGPLVMITITVEAPTVFHMDAREFVSPKSVDVMLTDVDEDLLNGEISRVLHVQYLSSVPQPQYSHTITGYVHGNMYRPVVNMVLASRDTPTAGINVIFIIDTGAPYTYISRTVARALNVPDDEYDAYILVHGQRTAVHISSGHFQHVSVLGGNWMYKFAVLNVDYKSSDVTLTV